MVRTGQSLAASLGGLHQPRPTVATHVAEGVHLARFVPCEHEIPKGSRNAPKSIGFRQFRGVYGGNGLALVNTAFAFTLWNKTLQTLPAMESSMINNTMLVQIAILAWLFLGETITPLEIVGLLLATIGVVAASRLNHQ